MNLQSPFNLKAPMTLVERFFLVLFQRATQDIHTSGKMHQAIMDDLGVILFWH